MVNGEHPNRPRVRVRRIGYGTNIAFSIVLAAVLAILFIVVEMTFTLSTIQRIIWAAILIIFYVIVSPMIMRPVLIREIRYPQKGKLIPSQSQAKIAQKPQTQSKTAVKPPKRNAFVGHSESRIYHKNDCRLAKNITRKFRETSNLASYFKNRKYKACKICIKK